MSVIHYTRHNRPKFAGQEPYAGYVTDSKGQIKKDKDGKPIPLDPGLTKQEMSGDTDVNRIMAKYEPGLATKMLHAAAMGGDYGDLTNVPDFRESMHKVMEAEEAFRMMPAKLRARFDNEPLKMLEFVHNPANREEMYELGLAIRPQPTAQPEATSKASQGVKEAPPKEGAKA